MKRTTFHSCFKHLLEDTVRKFLAKQDRSDIIKLFPLDSMDIRKKYVVYEGRNVQAIHVDSVNVLEAFKEYDILACVLEVLENIISSSRYYSAVYISCSGCYDLGQYLLSRGYDVAGNGYFILHRCDLDKRFG